MIRASSEGARRGGAEDRDAPKEWSAPRELAVEDLLGADGRLIIRHGRWRYLLRLTRQNRLLLTKEEGGDVRS